MTEFFVHAVILLWSIIGSILGAILLLAFFGLVTHEIFVMFSKLFINPNKENDQ